VIGNFPHSESSGGRPKRKPSMYTQCGNIYSAEVASRGMENLG
jgi:hypothetical protein